MPKPDSSLQLICFSPKDGTNGHFKDYLWIKTKERLYFLGNGRWEDNKFYLEAILNNYADKVLKSQVTPYIQTKKELKDSLARELLRSRLVPNKAFESLGTLPTYIVNWLRSEYKLSSVPYMAATFNTRYFNYFKDKVNVFEITNDQLISPIASKPDVLKQLIVVPNNNNNVQATMVPQVSQIISSQVTPAQEQSTAVKRKISEAFPLDDLEVGARLLTHFFSSANREERAKRQSSTEPSVSPGTSLTPPQL